MRSLVKFSRKSGAISAARNSISPCSARVMSVQKGRGRHFAAKKASRRPNRHHSYIHRGPNSPGAGSESVPGNCANGPVDVTPVRSANAGVAVVHAGGGYLR
eukprot:641964-Pyramimonas_sp.AAC.1